ncbi:MAG TPA: bifunctional transaldolase/phosoglucose isomerase [Actinomycetota bacterium]|nr:bifunctional transaldolase/phosoglucose isomerase [Actinomycetota bacterium]
MNPLLELREAGQSVWLDFLRRGLVTGGGLQRLIDEDGLSGVTSNPSIFRKAIGGSTDYDEPVRALVEKGVTDSREIFYALALEDIQMAADLFRPEFDATKGKRGFVSFELESAIAHDTQASIDKAKELVARINRANVMIKVPGTAEGVPAVEELTAAGVNVNITLLFDVDRYEEVARAYIAGLQRRLAAGQPVDMPASVASFFVSRVDTAVDEQLPEGSPLRGRIAIANAKKAYQRFIDIFTGEPWERLAAAGARVQQPLWASTSTKNPAYRDVVYVEELVGVDTVNTMPEATVNAFRDHGVVRPSAVTEHVEGALAMLDELPSLGVDLNEVTATLLDKGLEAFEDDFAALRATIDEKVQATGEAGTRAYLGSVEQDVGARLATAAKDAVVPRIWRKAFTLWKPEPTEIDDRLGWLTVVDTMLEQVADLERFAKKAASDGLRVAVLCGMGGSSLAPEVFARTYGAADGALELIVLDTTHPDAIARVTNELPPEETLYVIASKSGTTLETNSHLEHFWARTPDGSHFVAITDPGTPLEKLARERGFRRVFLNPPDIGGRYSALSLFGLVPAALLGAPLFELLDAAQEMACACDPAVPAEQNPGAWLGAAIGEAARAGRDKLTFVLPDAIASFGDWVEQLIAESTGKEGTGIVPVVGEDLGTPEAYRADRVFITYGEQFSMDKELVIALPDRGVQHLGAEFFRWEFATAVAGYVLGINPFDQPNVASAKQATADILQAATPETPALDDVEGLLAQVKQGDYIALQAFIDPTEEARDQLQRARLALRDRFAVATTRGFGPRYLHSTGQLHKGGPNTGVFIQIVDDERTNDVPIPGKPFSFGALIDAQAFGDLRSLRAAGRRVARTTMSRLHRVIG